MDDDLIARRSLFVRLFNHTKPDPEFQDLAGVYGVSAIRLGEELIARNIKRISDWKPPCP